MGRTSIRIAALHAVLLTCWSVSADEGTGGGAPADNARPIDAFEVEVTGPEGRITVGDPIPVTIAFSLPAEIVFDSVDFRDAGHLQFLNREIEETSREDGGVDFRAAIRLVSYRPGSHRIGHFVLGLVGPDGVVRDRVVPGLEIQVVGLLANESDPELCGEKAGVSVLYWDHTLAWALGIGGGALLMVFLGALIAYARPRPSVEVPLPPPRPAHEVALEKLDKIRADRLVEDGRYMEYYIRLSEAVREYLGTIFGFDGLDMTTTEIRARMAGVTLPSSLGPEFLSNLLYECDLVKFAKYAPGGTNQAAALNSAYRLVYETTPGLDEHEHDRDDGGGR